MLHSPVCLSHVPHCCTGGGCLVNREGRHCTCQQRMLLTASHEAHLAVLHQQRLDTVHATLEVSPPLHAAAKYMA